MVRCKHHLVSLLVLAPLGMAKQQVQQVRVTSPVLDAGIYHVATGSWTRGGSTAQIGADTIYSATVPSGYFGTGWEGQMGIDEGILPGTSNPLNGPQDEYKIDGIQFAYCSNDSSVDWTFTLYDSYVPCDLPLTPANCINLAGSVPTVTTPGFGCWLVTLDLTGGFEICMQPDGGVCAPGYQGSSYFDGFGWGAIWTTPTGQPTGPLLSGYNPQWAPPGEGTCYNSTATCAAGNTGLGAENLFAIDNTGGQPLGAGCYWFSHWSQPYPCGGMTQSPGAQFHFELYTDCSTDCSGPCGVVYCDSDVNQTGDLSINTCSIAGTPVLTSSNVSAGLFAYHNVSASNGVVQDPPGSQGQLCLTGSTIGRYNADLQTVVADSFSTDLIHGNTGGGVGNLPPALGGALGTGQTWNFQGWVRVAGGSRWTDALEVTFEL